MPTTETVERFYHEFGIGGSKPGYDLTLQSGRVTGQRYILDIDGGEGRCFSGQLRGDLPSSLPLRVSGMNPNWSAVLYDRAQKKARPIGVFEERAWATVVLAGALDLFVGHPVIADNPQAHVQVTQTGEDKWHVEVHNPTDAAMKVTITANPLFDPMKSKGIKPEALDLPAGSSAWREM